MKLEDIIMPKQDTSDQLAQIVADLKFEDISAAHVGFVKRICWPTSLRAPPAPMCPLEI